MESALRQTATYSVKISLESKQVLQISHNKNVEIATNCHFTICLYEPITVGLSVKI